MAVDYNALFKQHEGLIQQYALKYLGKKLSANEVMDQIKLAVSKGWSVDQWKANVENYFASQKPTPGTGFKGAGSPKDYKSAEYIDLDKPVYTGQMTEAGQQEIDPAWYAKVQAMQEKIVAEAKPIPGALPSFGVMPDGTIVDFKNFSKVKNPDPATIAYSKLAQNNPKIPTFESLNEQQRKQLTWSRGYELKGGETPEEQALLAKLLAGDASAAGPLAKLRQARMKAITKSMTPFEQALKAFTLAGISTGFGAMLGPAGAALGAGMFAAPAGAALGGGLTNLVASNGDWKNAGIGAAGGFAGGLAGPAVSGAVGGGIPGGILGGAAGGAAQSGVKAGLTAGLGGEVDPWDILASTVAGGLGGGLTASGTAAMPADTNKFWKELVKMGSGMAAGQFKNQFGNLLPGDGFTGFKPDMPDAPAQMTPEQIAQKNAAEIAMYKAQLQERLDAYNAAKAEAMSAQEAKISEYKAKQAAALESLRAQALAYMEKANAYKTQPMPEAWLTPPPTPAAPSAPDPFNPSAALQGQAFAGDFPTTQAGDFPISQPGMSMPQSALAPKKKKAQPNLSSLPLNILQIQAALAKG